MISTSNRKKTKAKPSADRRLNVKSIPELIKLSMPYKNKLLLACLCVIMINSAQLLKPYILKIVIDDNLIRHAVSSGIYSITSLGIIYFLTSIMSGFFSYAQVNLVNRAGQEIIKDLRGRVFKTIQLLPLSYLDKTSSGRLITRATNDIAEIGDMYTDIVMNLFKDIFLLVGIVYAMVTLDLNLALVSFTVIPVMFALVIFIKNRIRENFFDMKHFIGKINGFMAENISGMKIIQIFRAEKEKEEEFLKLNNEYFKTTLIQVRLNSILRPASDFFQNLAVAILLWYGMDKVFGHTLQLGILFAFTTYVKQFFNPISDLADKYNSIQSALVSAERIFELLKQNEILEELDKGLAVEKVKGTIEFKNVWFSYNNKDWVLKDVSFKVEKGQSIAFVGETGAGKTTIISLVSNFYKIQSGEILIDGINIYDIKPKDLRRNISVVLQDAFLFSGDIRNNITLNDNIDEKQVNKALQLSCCSEFVGQLPGGIYEPVMERGNTLSAGQRQLISFARAIAHDPAVLVLDEATANIDTHTEKLIQKAIENISKNRTTLVIAHRLSTIRNADKIIVMKDGEIVEMGNHSELLQTGGYYAKMIQEGDTEIAVATGSDQNSLCPA